MDIKETRELLRVEYLQLQSTIGEFDSKSLTVKAWSVTFSMAAIGMGLATNTPILFLIASTSALIFWSLEGHWKTFQSAHYSRISTIEKYFATGEGTIVPLQISRSWSDSLRNGGNGRLFQLMKYRHVMLPHGIVVLAGVVLYLSKLK